MFIVRLTSVFEFLSRGMSTVYVCQSIRGKFCSVTITMVFVLGSELANPDLHAQPHNRRVTPVFCDVACCVFAVLSLCADNLRDLLLPAVCSSVVVSSKRSTVLLPLEPDALTNLVFEAARFQQSQPERYHSLFATELKNVT
jgi:hypothetical protein